MSLVQIGGYTETEGYSPSFLHFPKLRVSEDTMAHKAVSFQARFFSNIETIPETSCHWWSGGVTGNGYGTLWCNDRKRHIGAHRASYEIHFGEIPDGVIVCHKCDNPLCVNPEHLFLGTHSDNSQDRDNKGRGNRALGEASTSSKITDVIVHQARDMYDEGYSQVDITRTLGIKRGNVFKIVHRQTWKHI
jgi:hypothetical protein